MTYSMVLPSHSISIACPKMTEREDFLSFTLPLAICRNTASECRTHRSDSSPWRADLGTDTPLARAPSQMLHREGDLWVTG